MSENIRNISLWEKYLPATRERPLLKGGLPAVKALLEVRRVVQLLEKEALQLEKVVRELEREQLQEERVAPGPPRWPAERPAERRQAAFQLRR